MVRCCLLFTVLAVLVIGQGDAAHAAAGAELSLTGSLSSSAVEPGSTFLYRVEGRNVGDASTDDGEPLTFHATLPDGMQATGTRAIHTQQYEFPCAIEDAGREITCTDPGPLAPASSPAWLRFEVTVAVDPAADGRVVAEFTLSGGGTPDVARILDPTVIGPPLAFGIDAFDLMAVDDAGGTYSQAGGHPDVIRTAIDFNTENNPHPLKADSWPIEPARDAIVNLPTGFMGSTRDRERCTLSLLNNSDGSKALPLCPIGSQVGVMIPALKGLAQFYPGPIPVYNLEPPPDAPARFGMNVQGTVVVMDAKIRSRDDYGLSMLSLLIPEGLPLASVRVDFWGNPAAAVHDLERACPGKGAPILSGEHCVSGAEEASFLRNPTSCTSSSSVGLPSTLQMDSWVHPGQLGPDGLPDLSDPNWKSATSTSHQAPGYPLLPEEQGEPLGTTGCAAVPFTPLISSHPTTTNADSPSGFVVDLAIPQTCWEAGEFDSICQSDLKGSVVTLPEGMSVNPASASGQGSCSPDQIGLTTPVGSPGEIHFDTKPAACPDNSKIGAVEIETPLLDDPLKGGIYLAEQGKNPFGSLLAMYMVAEGSGVVIKQAVEVVADPQSGRLTTIFRETPQTPFSNLRFELFGGPRASLRTPPTCGTYTMDAELTPWARPDQPVTEQSSFQITGCGAGGFDPKLNAGTENPKAGAFSPLNLRLSREDGTQELGSLAVRMPEGLLGSLKGIPYCPEAALASVSGALGAGVGEELASACPRASEVGRVTVGSGAGPTPFFTSSGRAYLAGPYKGAPLSLAVVTPAVAGPFDLGSVVVRNALRMDPQTAQITNVSDPLPRILHGIPLDLRDVRVELNRKGFILNPTSCDEMAIEATLTSVTGATAERTERFQVGGCDRLGFKPRLSLRLKGKVRRGGNPSLRAVLRARPGDANIGKATVLLPQTELLESSHIGTTCTRDLYSAGPGGGAECPKRSVYGYAKAWSPLLDEPLKGRVFLRSNGGDRELPDLVASLGGQIHVDLVGYIDSVNERIRTRFVTVPDAPVSKFALTMQGGSKSLLANNTNICREKPRASVFFQGQNNKVRDFAPPVKASCGKKDKKHKQRR
jgi:hypothetical protein